MIDEKPLIMGIALGIGRNSCMPGNAGITTRRHVASSMVSMKREDQLLRAP